MCLDVVIATEENSSRSRVIYLALAILTIIPASASDWKAIAFEGGGFKFYVDLSSRVRSGDLVEAWQKQVEVFPSGERDFAKHLYVNDCRARRRALRSSIYFGALGGIIAQRTRVDTELDWQPVIPDSPGEQFFQTPADSKDREQGQKRTAPTANCPLWIII